MEANTLHNFTYIYPDKRSKVRMDSLRLRAYIGFNDWETKKLQDLVISFSFKYNVFDAVRTDSVKYAINYKKITKTIIKMVNNQSFFLIETVAEKIWSYIKQNPYVMEVTVKVEKPYALRFSDNVMIEISDQDRPNQVIIALGSNIKPKKNFKKALKKLSKIGSVQQKTDFIFTKPLKFKNQADFFNGAILFSTKYYYEPLKKLLKQIEADLGRVRGENKNGPRPIDLDIIAFNSAITDDELDEFDFLVDFVKELNPNLLNKTISI